MLTIHLHQVKFKAYHGLYPEETVLGNTFIIDLAVSYNPVQLPVTALEHTINYVDLFELVKKRMQKDTPLLETVASDIAMTILAQFSLAEKVNISIRKENPPITGLEGATGVSLILNRTDIRP